MIVWANLLKLSIFLENSTRPGILAIESGLSQILSEHIVVLATKRE